jgi:hypothetical protein
MQICKIKGLKDSTRQSESVTEIFLCDFCFHADSLRGEDAQVISHQPYLLGDNVYCDVCHKSLADDKFEEILLKKMKS